MKGEQKLWYILIGMIIGIFFYSFSLIAFVDVHDWIMPNDECPSGYKCEKIAEPCWYEEMNGSIAKVGVRNADAKDITHLEGLRNGGWIFKVNGTEIPRCGEGR